MPDRSRESATRWVRILWILLAVVVGITVISVLVLQTLAPGTVLGPR